MKRALLILLGVAVAAVTFLLPIPLTTQERYVAAVTLLMVSWWVTEAVPLEATALLPLALFPLTGVLSAGEAAAPYADKVIFLFLGGFIVAASMQRWNLHKRIALGIVSMVGTSPRRIVLGFLIATAFISMWISNTATAMMMIPIAISIITTIIPEGQRNGKKERSFATALVLSVAFAASIGGMATIIGSPPNGIFTAQLATIFPGAPRIDFFTWLLFGVPLMVLFIPLCWAWLVYGPFRDMPEYGGEARGVIDQELAALGPMSRGEKNTLVIFVCMALAWIFETTKVIGGVTVPGLDVIFPQIDDSTIAILGALALFLIPVSLKKREFTMDWKTAVQIPWGILILFGGGLALSVAFVRSGLAKEIIGAFSILDGLPVMLLVLLIAVVVVILTEVTSNTAIASILMPVMAVTSVGLGIHPILLMLTASICASMGFMLPVATPPNAIAFGTGYVSMRDMIRAGWGLDIIGVILWTALLFAVVITVLGIGIGVPPWAAP
ncbi:MAG: DASS family sodium-coupled anion symporter [Methanomicrobiales archaeon]|nr:DASS family sodium-coupled anion symporter [Methanomicrobiales archaeon]